MLESEYEKIKENWQEVKERLCTEFDLDDNFDTLIEPLQVCDYYGNTVTIIYTRKGHDVNRIVRYVYMNYGSFIEQTIEELTGIHCDIVITYEKS